MLKPYHGLILISLAASLSAANIFSENFEGSTTGYYTTGNNVSTSIFRVVGSNAAVDIVGPGDYGFLCSSPGASGSCLDTTGGGANSRGSVETILDYAFAPNNYTLSIGIRQWVDNFSPSPAGAFNATVRVSIGSFFSNTYALDGSNDGIKNINFTVASLTNARLLIEDLSGDASFAGAIIDNISVDTVEPGQIPEPSTYALFAAGLSALALARRKR